jgi:Mn-dependent DtxR family transcriptional regulator
MPRFLVETVSTFRHTYWIEAEEIDHAVDEVVMESVEELTQRHIGETIFNAREISDEDAKAEFFKEHPYLDGCNVDFVSYLHKIKY